ncbi:FYN-binding protein-like, partial [Astyanax mexicanus]
FHASSISQRYAVAHFLHPPVSPGFCSGSLNGVYSGVHTARSQKNCLQTAGSPRVPPKTPAYLQAPPTRTTMYSGQAPRLKPHPLKPDIGGVSMEAKFKPPVPVGKLPGSAPQPSKPPGISALKVAPEKGKREEGKGAPPAPTYNHKPLGGKFPPANEENQPKFPGASFPKTPPSWKKPPLKEVSSQSPAPTESGSTHNVASSVQLQKKMFMGRANESESQKKEVSSNNSTPNETGSAHNAPVPKTPPSWKKPPLKEVSSQSPAPSETGSTHNVASSVQLQKKMFMGRASESESQKKDMSGNTSALNQTGSAHNVASSVQLQKKLYMGRASESGPQNEGFGNNPAPSETGSAPNVASSIQLQKKLFMGRASQSEPQKDVSTRDSVSSAPNSSGSAQPRKKALPSLVILGTCPAKPGRPPHVDLHPFSSHVSAGCEERGGGVRVLVGKLRLLAVEICAGAVARTYRKITLSVHY